MLVLTLKQSSTEDVVLTLPDGRRIVVRLLETGRGRSRMAIDAPQDVRITREPQSQPERKT